MAFTDPNLKVIATTERLILREFNAEIDAQHTYLLNIDPDVLKYTGDIPFSTQEEAQQFLTQYKDYELHGMGRWALILKHGAKFIGWCGLKKHDNGMIDIGYRLMKEYWGKGFATEASKACLNYGFHDLSLNEIVGRVAAENPASIKVLEKCGFSFWKEDVCEGIENSLYYKLNKEDFIH